MKDLFICYKDSAGDYRFWPVPNPDCFLVKDIPSDVREVVAIMTKSHLEQIAKALRIEVLDN